MKERYSQRKIQGISAFDCKTEVSRRHIPTDSGIDGTVQQAITVWPFAVLDFRQCLATAHLQLMYQASVLASASSPP
jgi:hypothetical protein